MPDCPSLNVRFGEFVHWYGALDANHGPHLFKAVHDCQTIDDRGKHSHGIAGSAVDAFFASLQSAKMFPPPTTNPTSMPISATALISPAYVFQGLCVNGLAFGATAQNFAADFEDDSLVIFFHLMGCGIVES